MLYVSFHLLLRLLLPCVVLIFASRVQWHPSGDAQALFEPAQEDCASTCFIGIRPGVTTVQEALVILRDHEWIASPRLNASGRGYGDIRWDWSGLQPAWIDTAYPNRATFYWDQEDPIILNPEQSVIETLSLYTSIRMYNAQTWLGEPDSGTVSYHDDDTIGYAAAYHRVSSMIGISTQIPCPATLLSYWDARVKIMISIGRGSSQYVPPRDVINLC